MNGYASEYVGMDKEIHIVLINYYQHEADGNKQFIAFAQDYLAVEYNSCTCQYSDKHTPVQRNGIQHIIFQSGSKPTAVASLWLNTSILSLTEVNESSRL